MKPALWKAPAFHPALYLVLCVLLTLYKGYSVKAIVPLPSEQPLNPSVINYEQTLLVLIRMFLSMSDTHSGAFSAKAKEYSN